MLEFLPKTLTSFVKVVIVIVNSAMVTQSLINIVLYNIVLLPTVLCAVYGGSRTMRRLVYTSA